MFRSRTECACYELGMRTATLFQLAVMGLAVAACSSSAPDAGGTDAGTDSTGDADGTQLGSEGGGINLDPDSGPMPGGHIACNMGGWYRCDEFGQDCCVSKNVCYDPVQEPNFCP